MAVVQRTTTLTDFFVCGRTVINQYFSHTWMGSLFCARAAVIRNVRWLTCTCVFSDRLSTVGSRALPVAGPQTWNELSADVTSAESLTTFRRLLKTGSLFLTTYWTSTDCLRWT